VTVASDDAPCLLKADRDLPLVVDLDGTLILTDTLLESMMLALGRHPVRLFCLLPEALANRASFKRRVLALSIPDVATLPYDQRLLRLLRQESSAGRRLVLATGADEAIGQAVSRHLGIFSATFGSDGITNLTGARKAARLDAELGAGRWLYAGNSRQDLGVWPASAGALVVNGSSGLAEAVRAASVKVFAQIPPPSPGRRAWFRLLRLHQWSKNLLLFAPIILAHRAGSLEVWRLSFLGFLAFGLAASAAYVVNDLLDLQADRRHPTKRIRPLASGRIGIPAGLMAIAVLTASSVVLLAPLPALARWTLLTYVLVTTAYSLRLKTLLSLDVVTLAICYVLRLLFGSAVTGIPLSVWTVASAGFFFTSLAFAKRLVELRHSGSQMEPVTPGKRRAYHPDDHSQVGAQAAASGFLSIFVVALYINSAEVRILYSRPDLLWLLCPVLIWWLSRLLILAARATIPHDPVSFALRDRASWVTLGLLFLVLLIAK
jgi:4-hydroxybenzoate polyprenyltransferase